MREIVEAISSCSPLLHLFLVRFPFLLPSPSFFFLFPFKMTSAHRPTWTPAQGGGGKYDGSLGMISKQTSVRDAPGYTQLKFRSDIEDKETDDFKSDLEAREAKHFAEIRKEEERKKGIIAITGSAAEDEEQDKELQPKKSKLLAIQANRLDEDLPEEEDEEDDNESDSDSDDDEDDTAQLLAELEKIKKERAEEQARKEEMKAVEHSRVRMESIVRGNPLLNDGSSGDFTVKRRWDEDTVFKNCARGDDGRKKTNYINDTLRSESHMKFMQRYIK
eukprot:m.219594 g.219594  ORF g.219594 m.219594 type:complete len:276 (-) comp17003_c1_seq1:3584-4411(-)